MNREEILERWLDAYDEQREQGLSVDLSELCRDHPDLAPELRRRIEALQAIEGFAAGDRAPGRSRASPARAAVAATAFGRYRALRFHAAGGLGEILLARDEEIGREVALKRIQRRWRASGESRRRFIAEAEITGRLEHPGIVPVYGLGADADGQPFYAMRFIHGRSLAQAIDDYHRPTSPSEPGERQLALRKLLGGFVAACRTTAFAHSLGVLHRDLKPANIMLGDYGETLVVDWGLAKAAHPLKPSEADGGALNRQPTETVDFANASVDGSLHTFDFATGEDGAASAASPGQGIPATLPGQIKGSPAYMSPEQAEGRWQEVSFAADIYSLGATLYSLLSGAPPVQGDTVGEVLAKVRAGQIAPLRELAPQTPLSLAAICEMAMKWRPSERYSGATELADDVERWLADEPVVARRENARERAARWLRRHKAWTQAGAAALVAIAVVSLAALAVVDRARRGEQAALKKANSSLVAETAAKNEARRAVDEYVRAVQDDVLLSDERFRDLRKRLLGHALDYYRRLIEENRDNPLAQRELSFVQRQAATIAMHTGSRGEALTALERSRGLLSRLASERPEDGELQFELAETLADLSDVQADSNEPRESEANMEKAREILVDLEKRHDSSRVQASLAACDRSLAKHRQRAGEFPQASRLLLAAIARYEKLEGKSDAPDFIAPRLAEAHRMRAELEIAKGADERSLAAAGKARAKLEALERRGRDDPSAAHPVIALERGRVENLIAALEIGRGELDEAQKRLAESAKRLEVSVRENPAFDDYRHLLAQTYNNLGAVHLHLGDAPRAIEALERTCDQHRWVTTNHPSFPYYRGEYAAGLLNLGVAYARAGQASEAEKTYRQSHEQYAMASASAPSATTTLGLGEVDQNLSILHLQQRNYAKARIAAASAAGRYRELIAQAKDVPEYELRLAQTLANLGQASAGEGKPDDAHAPFRESIDRLQSLADRFPARLEYRSELAANQNDYALALIGMRRLSEAETLLRAAIASQSAVAAASPETAVYRDFLGKHLWALADILREQGRKSEAAQAAAERMGVWLNDGFSAENLYQAAADLAALLDEPSLFDAHLPPLVDALRKHGQAIDGLLDRLKSDDRWTHLRSAAAFAEAFGPF